MLKLGSCQYFYQRRYREVWLFSEHGVQQAPHYSEHRVLSARKKEILPSKVKTCKDP